MSRALHRETDTACEWAACSFEAHDDVLSKFWNIGNIESLSMPFFGNPVRDKIKEIDNEPVK